MNPLPLGNVAGIPMKAKLSDTSSVANLNAEGGLQAVHLTIVSEDEVVTWDQARAAEMGEGALVTLAARNKNRLVAHFLPAFDPSEVECRYEVNSDGAASRPTIHAHVIMAHKTDFGPSGRIRRCVDDVRKPKALMAEGARTLQQNLDYQEGRRDLGDDIAQMDPVKK